MGGNKVAPEGNAARNPHEEASLKLDWSKLRPQDQPLSQRVKGLADAFANTWWYVVRTKPHEEADVKERLKSFWGTMGIVSALLLTMTYSTSLSPMDVGTTGRVGIVMTANVMGVLSFAFSLSLIVMVSVFLVEVDYCVTDGDLQCFVKLFGKEFSLIIILFIVSLLTLLCQVLLAVFVRFPFSSFLIVFIVAMLLVSLCLYCFLRGAEFTRMRLWYRVKEIEKQEEERRSQKLGGEVICSAVKEVQDAALDSITNKVLKEDMCEMADKAIVNVMQRVMEKVIEKKMMELIGPNAGKMDGSDQLMVLLREAFSAVDTASVRKESSLTGLIPAGAR